MTLPFRFLQNIFLKLVFGNKNFWCRFWVIFGGYHCSLKSKYQYMKSESKDCMEVMFLAQVWRSQRLKISNLEFQQGLGGKSSSRLASNCYSSSKRILSPAELSVVPGHPAVKSQLEQPHSSTNSVTRAYTIKHPFYYYFLRKNI